MKLYIAIISEIWVTVVIRAKFTAHKKSRTDFFFVENCNRNAQNSKLKNTYWLSWLKEGEKRSQNLIFLSIRVVDDLRVIANLRINTRNKFKESIAPTKNRTLCVCVYECFRYEADRRLNSVELNVPTNTHPNAFTHLYTHNKIDMVIGKPLTE